MNDSLIYMCNVPELDVNNTNSIDFKNLDKQYEFFISRVQKEVIGTKFIRKKLLKNLSLLGEYGMRMSIFCIEFCPKLI